MSDDAIQALPFLVAAVSAAYAAVLGYFTGRITDRIYPEDAEVEEQTAFAIRRLAAWAVDIQLLGTSGIAWAVVLASSPPTAIKVLAIAVLIGVALSIPAALSTDPATYGSTFGLRVVGHVTFCSIAVIVVNGLAAASLLFLS